MPEFAHLHAHSQYSVGDGHCTVQCYVDLAKADGQKAVALTDHGNIAAAIELYKACKENDLKAIIGCELYVDFGSRPNYPSHLTVLAADRQGYRDLITAVSMSHANFYYRPRIDIQTLIDQKLMAHWIVLSGCRSGLLDHALLEGTGGPELIEILRTAAGQFYLEVMYHPALTQETADKRDRLLALKIVLSDPSKGNIPAVLTNDCHYATAADEEAHQEWAMAANTEENHVLTYDIRNLYFRPQSEMWYLAQNLGLPESFISNTQRIVADCKVKIPEVDKVKWSVPIVALNPEMVAMTMIGDISGMGEEYQTRLQREMNVLSAAPHILQSYLVAADIMTWCREKDLPAFCRGSMAGSIVSWLLHITHDDPILHNLKFERAVNPARPTIPDFDIDVSSERRGEVLEYILAKYPESQPICSYSHYGPRGATKIVLRGMGTSFAEANKLTKRIPEEWDSDYEQLLPENVRPVVKTFQGVLGNVSIHPAGIVLGEKDRPLAREVPKTWVPSSKQFGSQFDMYSLKSMGLFKLDILGLKTLDQLKRMADIAGKMPPAEYDDPKVLDIFKRGLLSEVFQFDGWAVRNVLHDIGVDSFEDLVAANALARPGANLGVASYQYGDNALLISYPQLESVLGYSRGAFLYQEQAMEATRILAGFDDGLQDDVKEATKYFRAEVFEKLEPVFMEGCAKNGVEGHLVWDAIKRFSGYAFPRAHSVSYAGMAYRMAWYKAYFPQAFYTACFDDCDSRTRCLLESLALGVGWRMPTMNEMTFACRFDGSDVVLGLSAIKGMGERSAEAVSKAIPSDNVEDFLSKLNKSKCNKKNQAALADVGITGELVEDRFLELLGFSHYLLDSSAAKSICHTDEITASGFVLDYREFDKQSDNFAATITLGSITADSRVLLGKKGWRKIKEIGDPVGKAMVFGGYWENGSLLASHCDIY
jgi:DNA polymerase-3 subunit alpha